MNSLQKLLLSSISVNNHSKATHTTPLHAQSGLTPVFVVLEQGYAYLFPCYLRLFSAGKTKLSR